MAASLPADRSILVVGKCLQLFEQDVELLFGLGLVLVCVECVGADGDQVAGDGDLILEKAREELREGKQLGFVGRCGGSGSGVGRSGVAGSGLRPTVDADVLGNVFVEDCPVPRVVQRRKRVEHADDFVAVDFVVVAGGSGAV